MAIKIVKSTDVLKVENLIIVLYGQSGTGKTSLGFTSDKPLLLDFDLGVHRSIQAIKKDSVTVKTWADIDDLSKDDLSPFNTIIVDTVGRLLEAIEVDIKEKQPKMLNKSTGGLTVQGYGLLGNIFKNFLKKIRSYRKDIILICHDKEDKTGDIVTMRLDTSPKTAAEELKRMADIMGYIYMNGKDRYIDFNPTENHWGKNCAEIPEQKILSLKEHKAFLSDLISLAKERMNAKSEEQIKAEQEFQAVLDKIDEFITLEDFNKALVDYKDAIGIHKQYLVKSAGDKGLIFDKETKQFIEIAA